METVHSNRHNVRKHSLDYDIIFTQHSARHCLHTIFFFCLNRFWSGFCCILNSQWNYHRLDSIAWKSKASFDDETCLLLEQRFCLLHFIVSFEWLHLPLNFILFLIYWFFSAQTPKICLAKTQWHIRIFTASHSFWHFHLSSLITFTGVYNAHFNRIWISEKSNLTIILRLCFVFFFLLCWYECQFKGETRMMKSFCKAYGRR